MDTLSKEELRELIGQHEAPCISLYMPMHKAMPDAQQNPVRFRNLLHEAERRLNANGSIGRANGMLKPALTLLNDTEHWFHPADGMAAFISRDGFRHYRLPVPFSELLVVTERFHTKPLLPLLTGDGKFFVLALSQNSVRVLECSRNVCEEINVENMPRNRKQALNEQVERSIQFHTFGAPSAGERIGMFHGHGSSTDESKDFLLRYFREIDKALFERIKLETAPLIVAGVDYLHPIYKAVNTYPHLLGQGVIGNPELWTADDLRQQAWVAVEPIFKQREDEARARYETLKNGERSVQGARTIIPAAHYGRVDTLFVSNGEQLWGKFHPRDDRVEVHSMPENGDVDLLDEAATQTILNSGTVYALPPDQMPDHAALAAILRY